MKKHLLFLLWISAIGRCAIAQTIGPHSTLAECVGVINSIAQTYNGKDARYDYVRTYQFTGGSFDETDEWKYDVYKKKSQMNWADFDTVRSTPVADGGKVLVSISFKSKTLKRESYRTDKETGLVGDYLYKEADDFYFYLPTSEQGRVKDIAAAAERLSQIAKGKGNDFPTGMPFLRRVKNIEGKPGFDETVKYINTFLDDSKSNKLFCNTVSYYNRKAEVGQKENGKVYLVSQYLREGSVLAGSPRTNHSFLVDLSRVEEVRIVTGEGFQGGCLQVGLWFVEKGKSATPVMHLPLWIVANDSFDPQKLKEEKIYKAFDHLRKLSGAPEPIEF